MRSAMHGFRPGVVHKVGCEPTSITSIVMVFFSPLLVMAQFQSHDWMPVSITCLDASFSPLLGCQFQSFVWLPVSVPCLVASFSPLFGCQFQSFAWMPVSVLCLDASFNHVLQHRSHSDWDDVARQHR
jgi:hypothetical protein